MAKGAESKEKITQQILETFPGAFQYDKEIRIPSMENGELIQIKVTLTCAKSNVECGGEGFAPVSSDTEYFAEPTEEEQARVAEFVRKLGITAE